MQCPAISARKLQSGRVFARFVHHNAWAPERILQQNHPAYASINPLKNGTSPR